MDHANIRKVLLMISLIVVSSLPSFSQFGKLGDKLKEKAGDIVKDKLIEESSDKRDEYDTSSLNYAIAFLDKSESFENKQKGEGFVKTANFLLKDEEKTPREEARDLYEFGRVNYFARQYKIGELYLIAALVAFEVENLKNDPVYFKALGLLGLLYADMGRFNMAEEYTKRALSGWKEEMGKSSAGYAAEFHNMAVLNLRMGRYGKAEKELREAVEIIEEIEGYKSVPHAVSLNNLGILYVYLGRLDQSLVLLDQSLELAKKELRDKSGTYLQLMTNKALVHQEKKQYDLAEEIYLEALDLQKRRLKLNAKSDPDYAHMLNNLASLYVITDRLEEAEELLTESLEIYKDKFGAEHPSTASALSDLGTLYRYKGEFEQAKDPFLNAINTREKLFGREHPVTTQSIEDLAVAYWKLGEIENANKLFKEALTYSIEFINNFFPSLSEIEKTQYWNQLKPRFYTYFNFVIENSDQNQELINDLLKYRLMTKGLLLNSSTKIKNSILNSGDEKLIDLYKTWIDQKKTLASYYSLSRDEINEQKINIDSLENEANISEKLLSESSSDFSGEFINSSISKSSVEENLQDDQALIEIIHYPIHKNHLTEVNGYAALVLSKNQPPVLISIDRSGKLDTKSYAVYKNLIRLKNNDSFSYIAFWKPLALYIEGKESIIFSPDGVYNQLNINTLKDENDQFVLQKHAIQMVGNPLDIATNEKTKEVSNQSAFLLGFPVYGSNNIAPLPGTKIEVEVINDYLKEAKKTVTMKLQTEATEKAVKSVNNPGILHIATHGYFLEDKQAARGAFGVQIDYATENPLLRSGLMLAGASEQNADRKTFDNEDNGILTAYEAVNLPLAETSLVVLSACETGKGDIQSGEGVYGLQRALSIAGAEKLIMSLWKVDDTATQQLMNEFYNNWITNEMKVENAFRKAQLVLLEKYPSPYYWGAFILVN